VIRRMLMLCGCLVGALALTGIMATAASAQYVPGQPGIIVDPSMVAVGGLITVEGSGCPEGSTVTITIEPGGVVLGTVTAGDDGSFILSNVTLPPSIAAGQYTVHAVCGDLDLTAVLSVSAVAPSTVQVAPLPVTGTDSGAWVKIGLSLIAVGGLFVLAARRRHAAI
jgi:LPXTG-motif cell wall-anchored protein